MPYETAFLGLTPVVTNGSDDVPYTLGERIQVLVNGQIDGIEWFWPLTSPTSAPIALLYNDSGGAPLAQKTWQGSPAGGAKAQQLFDAPVAVSPGVYRACIWTPNRYVATVNGLLGDITNGNVKALAGGGRLGTGGAPVFPTNGSNTNYFADVLFQASSGDVTPPTAPSGLHFTAIGSTTVGLAWNASTDAVGVTGYDVYVDGILLTTIGNVLTYTVTALAVNSLHTFTVRARDSAGNISAASNTIATYTDLPFTVPSYTAELAEQRRLTSAFIAADPSALSFVRAPLIDDGAGGYRHGAPTTLPSQVVKVVRLQDTLLERNTEDGRSIAPSFVLVCEWDADIARWDKYVIAGATFEIVSVVDRGYELKAEVVYLG
jgi:hypothetical protein